MARRRKTVRKPYMTKKRKAEKLRREVRSTIAIICLAMISTSLVALAETTKNFTIEIKEKTAAVITEPVPEVVEIKETDYSGIPYIEKIKPPVKEQIRSIAEEECSKLQLGTRCVEDTLGIAWNESRFDCSQIGDGGKSYGCFQIYRKAHPEVTVSEARDIDFATRWTVRNLAGHGYVKNRDRAVRMHNGDPTITQTKIYLDKINEYVKSLKF